MPDTVLELVRATREDAAAIRQELGELRREHQQTRDQVTTIAAEHVATRSDLSQHRQDDQVALADHERRLRSLSRWRWTVAGVVAGLVGLAGLAGPDMVRLMAGG